MTPSMKAINAIAALRNEGLRPPVILTFAITGICNLHCSHCWVDAGGGDSAPHVPRETVRRLIEEFARLGGEGIRLTGGEPLCHPDAMDLLRFCREMAFARVGLQTNGVRIDEEVAAALGDIDFPGLDLQISLDGAAAASHDLVRGSGAFEGALRGIERLVKIGLGGRITLLFTEMGHNLAEFPRVLELAERYGIASVLAGTLIAGGRGGERACVAPPDPEHYETLFDLYDADPDFRLRYARIGKMAALEWLTAEGPDRCTDGCTFVENPYLSAGGKLYPCVLCHAEPHAVTDLFETPLADAFAQGALLWSALRQMSLSRARSLAPCLACAAVHTCCGGCMGRALGSSADLMAPDDRCAVRQLSDRRKRR